MFFKKKLRIDIQKLNLKQIDNRYPSFRILTVDVVINGKLHLSQLVQINCPKGTRYFELYSKSTYLNQYQIQLVNTLDIKYRGKIKCLDIILRDHKSNVVDVFLDCSFEYKLK